MKLYTSYYAKESRASHDALLVRVSNTIPDWFRKSTVVLPVNVFPDWTIINAFKSGELSYEAFCEEYIKRLSDKVQPAFLLTKLEELAQANNKDTVILLCYEKDGNACHRTALANYIDDGCYCGEL